MNTRKNIQMAALLVAAAVTLMALTVSAAQAQSVVGVRRVHNPPPPPPHSITSFEQILWPLIMLDTDGCTSTRVQVLRTHPTPPVLHPHSPVGHHWGSSRLLLRSGRPGPAVFRSHVVRTGHR